MSDTVGQIGPQYAAYFRVFYGEDAPRVIPRWHWLQDSLHEAFVVTAPSEMYGSAQEMWTYDLSTCSWGRGPMVADRGADGGEQYRLDTWIVDLDNDGARDLAQRVKNWGEDDEGKPYLSSKYRMYLWNGNHNYFAETYVPPERQPKVAFDFKVP